jgi:hypothetical protein
LASGKEASNEIASRKNYFSINSGQHVPGAVYNVYDVLDVSPAFEILREKITYICKEENVMERSMGIMLVLIVGLAMVAGCAAKEVSTVTPIQEMDAPEWVMKGGGAFGGDSGKVFYGVGSAAQMKNFSLLRSTADNRARSDLSKVFQFYTASLMKDYMASTVAGDPNVTSEEQHVEQAIKTVTSMTLSGVEIVDHWQNRITGEFFSLARLNLSTFKDNLEKARELDRNVKEYIKENANRLHDELDKEESKMEGK